jgi:hypothetical protein
MDQMVTSLLTSSQNVTILEPRSFVAFCCLRLDVAACHFASHLDTPLPTMFLPHCSRAATRLVVQTASRRSYAATATVAAKAAFPAPRLFDYETVTSNLSVVDAIDAVEAAFGALAKGKVDVPMPMHIGIEETDAAGPGDCHISKSG